MKRIAKSKLPESLRLYLEQCPEATWDEMRNDGLHYGMDVARECRNTALADQYGLCAYCEQKINPLETHKWRLEHFHPKVDRSEGINWDLNWQNIFAVCNGGEQSQPRLLSCDSYKNQRINLHKLEISCEGWIINPLTIEPFPNLFSFNEGKGSLFPNEDICQNIIIAGNKFSSTAELVQNTIDKLNLNCLRLVDRRKELADDIASFKETLREKRISGEEYRRLICSRWLSKPWPEFFTTIRNCLGPAAEDYLRSINYQG